MRPDTLLAGRYRLTDPPPTGDHWYGEDIRSGAAVVLSALELPELVGVPYGEEPSAEPGQRIAAGATAVAAGAPDHPRLLRGLDALPEGEVLWVVEEWLPGEWLAELAQAGPVSPYRVAELGADLAAALRALHGAGLTHGNLTAETVLVCEDGAALLGGLPAGAAEEALCAELSGTQPEFSPWAGQGGTVLRARRMAEARAALLPVRAERWPAEPGPAADCWALGVLLHRLLTGRAPYPEDDLPTLLAAVRAGGPLVADGCGPLRPLVERLLGSDPAARPTAGEVRRELAALLAEAPEPHGPAAAALLPVLRVPSGPVVVAPDVSPQRRPARSGLFGPLLVGGVLLVLATALAAVALLAR